MKAVLEKTPTEISFIKISQTTVNWHNFPAWASKFFKKIQAAKIVDKSQLQIFDMHWYEFDWGVSKYRLIFEEWPFRISIESIDENANLISLMEIILNIELNVP